MTDNEKKYKAAFMELLIDFQTAVYDCLNADFDELPVYCQDLCPLKDNCPLLTADEDHYCADDCYEGIFKWYLELVTKKGGCLTNGKHL